VVATKMLAALAAGTVLYTAAVMDVPAVQITGGRFLPAEPMLRDSLHMLPRIVV
jgi:hypothetical protein